MTRAVQRGLAWIPGAGRLLQRTTRVWLGGEDDRGLGSSLARLPVVPRERRLAMLRIVEAALNDHGVEYRSCITGKSAYCAVNDSSLDSLCKALNALGHEYGFHHVHVWLGRDFSYDNGRFAESLTISDIAACHSMVVAIPLQVERYRVARLGGAEILVIERRGARHVARRRRAEKVDWTSDFDTAAASSRLPGARRSTGNSDVKLHALEDEPIDVVYTWVDSTDTDWDSAMREWAKRENIRLDSSSNHQRYLNRDELRYSLRSLWLYAPFVRNVYIVTAGHHPPWLNVAHDSVHLIPHSMIFPHTVDLPTFNSHAIEACLHRIPGLSEHFIYFNDDVFLACETTVSTFFTKAGLIKSRLSNTAAIPVARPDVTSTPTDWASYNAAAIIARDFGLQFDRKLKHVPMALKRGLLEEMEGRYGDLFVVTRSSRFRSQSDVAVPTMFAHFYGMSTGKAVEWEHIPGEYVYADTGRFDFESRISSVTDEQTTFLCLNATRHDDISLDRQAHLLRTFFEERYPIPSPFEAPEEPPLI